MPDTNFPWQKEIDVVETIKRLVKDSNYDLATPQTYGEFRALALMAAQELEAARSRWISMEEKLPEEGLSVIVHCSDGRVRESWMRNGFFRDAAGRHIGIRITHWMPLPEPPKEE